ncbi:MAG: chemotaxis protein [Alphaproteobacteria bacterium]|nr:chemotaxis protein [Alphaproteobacteria bacterium]
MLDPSTLLTQATDAYANGAQKRVAGQAAAAKGMSEAQAKEASEQFESFFIGQMLEYMNTDINSDGLFGGGHAEEVWRSMLNQEYGKEIAKSSSLGVSDAVMRSLLQAQGEATTGNQSAIAAPDQAELAAPIAAAASKERMN